MMTIEHNSAPRLPQNVHPQLPLLLAPYSAEVVNMERSTRGALVVLSGGQDSTTCLYWALNRYARVEAISFNYGQRHDIELEAAATVAHMAGVKHEVVDIRGLLRSASPLVDHNAPLEKYEDAQQMAQVIGNRVEKTFVPMRNTVFLTIAANYALAAGLLSLVTGVCGEDNANYPDCTDRFVKQIETTMRESLGQLRPDFVGERLSIRAPLMFLSKADTVRLATQLPGCMMALAYSHTSYDGKYPPTDMNHSNVLRAQGFLEAGIPDPLVVRAALEGLMELPTTPNYSRVAEGGHA